MRGQILAPLVLTLAISTVLVACENLTGGIEGSGNVVAQDMAISGFNKVEVESTFDVTISAGATYMVKVEADDNLLEYLDVKKSGETLQIRLRGGTSIRNGTFRAELVLPELLGVNFSGASKGEIQGFESSRFDASLSGASFLTADIATGHAEISMSGASVIDLHGTGTTLALTASGASRAELEEFSVDIAQIKLSGATTARVNVKEAIDPISLTGASRLVYSGNPAVRNLHTSGASTLDSQP